MARKDGRGTLKERFLAKITHSNSGCWEWIGYRRRDGYALIWRENRAVRANRVAYELFHRLLLANEVVCHRCDNPGCVNPEHLFVGDRGDNNRDCVSKRRHAFGARNGQSKLTFEQVSAIRANVTSSQRELAHQYGVGQDQISRIKAGLRWGMAVAQQEECVS